MLRPRLGSSATRLVHGDVQRPPPGPTVRSGAAATPRGRRGPAVRGGGAAAPQQPAPSSSLHQPVAAPQVHRHDAGRGPHRQDDDRLLSAAGARRKFKAGDVGVTTSRPRDDGPWDLRAGAVARWTPGPTLGSLVVRAAVGDARVLFSGRLAGYDERSGAVSAFATEAEHSAAAVADALFALADADDDWDFEWLLPSRGRPVRFASAAAARDALRSAARRAGSVGRGGMG